MRKTSPFALSSFLSSLHGGPLRNRLQSELRWSDDDAAEVGHVTHPNLIASDTFILAPNPSL